jgi:hypothetical protein
MAYRTVREAGGSHHDALDAAEAVYFQARPEALADNLEASGVPGTPEFRGHNT